MLIVIVTCVLMSPSTSVRLCVCVSSMLHFYSCVFRSTVSPVHECESKNEQYPGFARAHAPYYWLDSTQLNFRDRTRPGAVYVIWPFMIAHNFTRIQYTVRTIRCCTCSDNWYSIIMLIVALICLLMSTATSTPSFNQRFLLTFLSVFLCVTGKTNSIQASHVLSFLCLQVAGRTRRSFTAHISWCTLYCCLMQAV